MRTVAKGNATEAAVLNGLRVQCKTARLVQGCVAFNAHRTDHGTGRRRHDGLADVFGVHFRLTETLHVVPVHDVSSIGPRLRLKPTLNNQAQGIRYAEDYELSRWSVDALIDVARHGLTRNEPAASVA
jgi:hypothetical protein